MKNKKILGLVSLAAVTVVGGSFAYFNQTQIAENPFDTGSHSTTLEEKFNPKDGDDWKPGEKVNKQVEVKNTGNQPVVVRVKFDEEWAAKEGFGTWKKVISSTTESKVSGGTEYAIMNHNPGQAVNNDGKIYGDDTVVEKELLNVQSTENPDNKWVLGPDGWYYYVDVLQPAGTEVEGVKKDTTGTFLNSVTLNKDLDEGNKNTVWTVEFDDKVKTQDGASIPDKMTLTDKEGKKILTLDSNDDTQKGYLKKATKDGKEVDVIDWDKIETLYNFEEAEVKSWSEEKTSGKEEATAVAGEVERDCTGYNNANYQLTVTSQTVQLTNAAIVDSFFKGDAYSAEEVKAFTKELLAKWGVPTAPVEP